MVTFPPTPDNPAVAYGDTNAATLAATRVYMMNLGIAIKALQTYVLANAGSGGVNLTLSGYLAIGATPALTGSIRMTENTYIKARDTAFNGDVPLIGFDNVRQAILIGDDNYPNIEPGGTAGFLGLAGHPFGLYASTINLTGDITPTADGVSSVGSDANRLATAYADAFIGTDILALLPSVDPAIAGRFFTSTGAALAGNLAAGALYVLVSDGP